MIVKNTVERSKGPGGVLTAGIIGMFSPFALMTTSHLQEKVSSWPKYDHTKWNGRYRQFLRINEHYSDVMFVGSNKGQWQ